MSDRQASREAYRRWCETQPRGRYERVAGRIVAPPGLVLTVEALFGRG